MTETQILRTSIQPKLMKRTLLFGFSLAFAGILILLLAGIYVSETEMSFWGFPLFGLGMALIVIGLLPYRRLTRLELKPNLLTIVDEDCLEYRFKGKKVMTVPLKGIEEVIFIERGSHYGIGINLKDSMPEKICVHQSHFDMNAFQEKSRVKFGCDMFFPYFTQRSFDRLKLFSG